MPCEDTTSIRGGNLRKDNKEAMLLFATIKPHKAVVSSTARWLKTTMGKAGIDVKAHSVRSSVSTAANVGVTTADIGVANQYFKDSITNHNRTPLSGELSYRGCQPLRNKVQNYVDMGDKRVIILTYNGGGNPLRHKYLIFSRLIMHNGTSFKHNNDVLTRPDRKQDQGMCNIGMLPELLYRK